MDILTLAYTDLRYPPALKMYLNDDAPASIFALGDLGILKGKTLALFSSVKCPGNLILRTYDLAQKLRSRGVAVIGGFHSPMERETLAILLRGKQPVVICPARDIGPKMAHKYAELLEQRRLLILSPFNANQSRITAETSVARNCFVAALADAVFVAYAEPRGKMEQLCHRVLAWKKPLCTLESNANAHLIALRAKTVNADTQFDLLLENIFCEPKQ